MYVYMYTYIYTILFTVYSLFDQFEFKQFTLFYLVNQYLQNIYLCCEKYIYTYIGISVLLSQNNKQLQICILLFLIFIDNQLDLMKLGCKNLYLNYRDFFCKIPLPFIRKQGCCRNSSVIFI